MKVNKKKRDNKIQVKKCNFWNNKYLPFGLIIYILILYGNTFNHSFVLDDDIVYLKNSFVLQGFNGIDDIFSHGFTYGFNKDTQDQSYRPLTLTSFAIEKELFNKSSSASHALQVILYILSCLILLKLLLLFFRDKPVLAYLITLIFASHPVHTEVVANIKSRDEILAFLFIVLTLYTLYRYLISNKIYLIITSILSYFLALLSKENSLALIGVIPFFIFISGKIKWKQNIYISLIYLSFLLIYLLIRSSVLTSVTIDKNMDIINNTLMAATNQSDQIATAFYILFYYIKLLFVPYPLSFDYSYSYFSIVSWNNFLSIISLFLYLTIFVFAIYRIFKKHTDGLGLLFFLALLSVSSNLFVKIGATFAERFLFTPSLGFIIAIFYFLWETFCRKKSNTNFIAITFLIIITFSFITHSRNNDWKSNFTLFESALKAAPNSARVQSSMGSEYRVLAEKSQNPNEKSVYYDKAVLYYNNAIQIYPNFTDALYNLGVSYHFWGKTEMAKNIYLRSLKSNPTHINTLNNLGAIYFNNNQLDSAKILFEKILTIDSTYASAITNLGSVYHLNKDFEKAIFYYEKSLIYDKNNKKCISNLLNACKAINDTERIRKYEAELSL